MSPTCSGTASRARSTAPAATGSAARPRARASACAGRPMGDAGGAGGAEGASGDPAGAVAAPASPGARRSSALAEAVIGIDIGTTSTKALAYGLDGRIVARHAVDTALLRP